MRYRLVRPRFPEGTDPGEEPAAAIADEDDEKLRRSSAWCAAGAVGGFGTSIESTDQHRQQNPVAM